VHLAVGGGGWCSNNAHRPYKVGLWKNIKRGWSMFSIHTRFDIGDGSKIKF
jgi:hypothetical protein